MSTQESILGSMRSVSVEDQLVFEKYYTQYPQEICEYTFPQMLLWGEDRNHLWTEYEGHLIVSFQKRGEKQMFYEPIGPAAEKIIAEVLTPSEGHSYLYLSENLVQKLPSSLNPKEEPDRFDYIYSVDAMKKLEGGAYAEKRNFIKRARKNNPDVVVLSESMADECIAMLERWMNLQPREGMNSLMDEITSIRLAMQYFDQLKFFGVGIRIAGQLEAMSLGVPQNESMFVEYFQKSTNAYPGLYPLVFHELANHLPAQFTEINFEEDLGIPGLRTAKERWNPARKIKKYSL